MGLLKLLKDVVLLPIDIAQDITGISVIKRVIEDDCDDDIPFDTVKRLKSLKQNYDDTFD